ncbi:unnamed protein product [Cyclocybe aegerita]|uniref:Aminodeoxychorismate lyase n=1 Tax=Cyclocybe aegerita TaxID=1973307 RepID=A0A8S0WT07_CYCAE|nr:unnamed protein product [Cyclocybe aegerita]
MSRSTIYKLQVEPSITVQIALLPYPRPRIPSSYMPQQSPDYLLLTSTRYDPFLEIFTWNYDDDGPSPFFLLRHHCDRLNAAIDAHDWPNARSSHNYSNLKAACVNAIIEESSKEDISGAYYVRITLSRKGEIAVTASPLPARFSYDPLLAPLSTAPSGSTDSLLDDPPPLSVFLDKQPTPTSIFTQTKTTFRQLYEQAKERNRHVLGSTSTSSDILLYNLQEQLLETTIFNIAFYRSGKWLTPKTTSGCLSGVIRRWLLEHERIREDTEGVLMKADVREGELVLLFNGHISTHIGETMPSLWSHLRDVENSPEVESERHKVGNGEAKM